MPKEERDLQEVKKIAADLHEDMRNYGSLEGDRKATTVAAILLALKERHFRIDQLDGSTITGQTDGWKVFNAASSYLDQAYLGDDTNNEKRGAVKDQLAHIRGDVTLNQKRSDIGMTPLRKFAQALQADVLDHLHATSSFDILGNFFGEFVRYGGSDGNALGIVLTPHHITTLMADLIDVNADDYVIDPCAGTASFLIAAMRRMVGQAKGDQDKIDEIRSSRLHGIELQGKLYTIGVANMILRGDGKAHFYRDDMFHVSVPDIRTTLVEQPDGKTAIVETGFTKCLMNPPYSQAKNKDTRHLSEMSFVQRALDMMNIGGRLAAIVPESAMTNKSGNQITKAAILKSHTLDSVITLNPQTFYGVGTHTVIALFTAGKPHPGSRKVKFIDFRDDGRKVLQNVGLVGDGTENSKKDILLEICEGDLDPDSRLLVKSTVAADDEWLHSFFYSNDDTPTDDELRNTVADYLVFEFSMIMRRQARLLPRRDGHSHPGRTVEDPSTVQTATWDSFRLLDHFTAKRGRQTNMAALPPGETPLISAKNSNNGLKAFVTAPKARITAGHAITLNNDGDGGVGLAYYQPFAFTLDSHVTALRPTRELSREALLFVCCAISKQRPLFSHGRSISEKRLHNLHIMLPASNGQPDWTFMEAYVHDCEAALQLAAHEHGILRAPTQPQ